MNCIIIILVSALIIESLLLILLLYFYKNEKEKVEIERVKRAEDKVYINIFIEYLEKRAETYELLYEFKRILAETFKEDQKVKRKPCPFFYS